MVPKTSTFLKNVVVDFIDIPFVFLKLETQERKKVAKNLHFYIKYFFFFKLDLTIDHFTPRRIIVFHNSYNENVNEKSRVTSGLFDEINLKISCLQPISS